MGLPRSGERYQPAAPPVGSSPRLQPALSAFLTPTNLGGAEGLRWASSNPRATDCNVGRGFCNGRLPSCFAQRPRRMT